MNELGFLRFHFIFESTKIWT